RSGLADAHPGQGFQRRALRPDADAGVTGVIYPMTSPTYPLPLWERVARAEGPSRVRGRCLLDFTIGRLRDEIAVSQSVCVVMRPMQRAQCGDCCAIVDFLGLSFDAKHPFKITFWISSALKRKSSLKLTVANISN